MSIHAMTILNKRPSTKFLGAAWLFQACHPERSAIKIYPDDGDWRGVEGSRRYFNLENRYKAFSGEFPVAVFPIEASSGCFDSRSLNMTGS